MALPLAAARSDVDEDCLIKHVMFTDDYLPCLVDSERAWSSSHSKFMCDVFLAFIVLKGSLTITIVWMCQGGSCSEIIRGSPTL
jgi:hypothetical protein